MIKEELKLRLSKCCKSAIICRGTHNEGYCYQSCKFECQACGKTQKLINGKNIISCQVVYIR